MRRQQSSPIGLLPSQYLREEGLETPLNEHRLVESWPQVMGPVISRYTGKRFIKDRTLYVQILSAPLKHELTMLRSSIVQKLNQHVQAQVITDIRFL